MRARQIPVAPPRAQTGDTFTKIPEVYIRGNTIKYLRIPEEVIDKVQEDANLFAAGGGYAGGACSDRGGRGGGRGGAGGDFRGGRGGGRGTQTTQFAIFPCYLFSSCDGRAQF